MRFFGRRPPDVPADIGAGFWVSETRALQRALVAVLTGAERAGRRTTTTQLEFSPGAEGNVVVIWRNAIVGFVPSTHSTALGRQLREAGKATLVSDGHALDDGDLWRIWVGPGEPETPPPTTEMDQIAPAPATIFGFALRNRDSGTARPRRERTTTAPPQLLTIGFESWDVRDGADLDLDLLRRRFAAAGPGETLHLRIWDQRVAVRPDTRVTLTDPVTGEAEHLHPR